MVPGISGLRTLDRGSKKAIELCDFAAFSLLEMAESTFLVDVFGGIAESGRLDQDLVRGQVVMLVFKMKISRFGRQVSGDTEVWLAQAECSFFGTLDSLEHPHLGCWHMS